MKRNILLLHGALGTKEQFKELEQHLKDYYNVWTFNFEGHGKSTSVHEFSIQLFVKNTLQFMKSINLEKADFFGYSMGGYVALNVALQYPKKVKSVITLGTKFNWNAEIADKEIHKLKPELIEEKVPHFAEHLSRTHLNWKGNMLKTAQLMYNLGNGEAIKDEEFSQIKQPCLLCIGDKDRMSSIEETKWICSKLFNCKCHILKEAPHELNKLKLEVLIQTMKNFYFNI